MNKKLIETYKQLDIATEDMYFAEYGPLILDLGCYGDGEFIIKVIKNFDWEKPIDEFRFKTKDENKGYDEVGEKDSNNIKRYLKIYKDKFKKGEYDNNYEYSFENISQHFFAGYIKPMEGFYDYCKEVYDDEDLELSYTVTGNLARFVKDKYLDDEFNLIGDVFEFNHIIDVTNEFITYGDHSTKELIIVGFIEDLQIPEEYLDNMKKLVRYPKLKKAIQDVHNFWTKGILIP